VRRTVRVGGGCLVGIAAIAACTTSPKTGVLDYVGDDGGSTSETGSRGSASSSSSGSSSGTGGSSSGTGGSSSGAGGSSSGPGGSSSGTGAGGSSSGPGGSSSGPGGSSSGTGGSSSGTGGSSSGAGGSSSGPSGSSSGTGGSSSGTGDAGPACSAPIDPSAITTTAYYVPSTVLGAGGFTFSYSDGNGSTACVDTDHFCGTGVTGIGDSLGAIWGAQIGVHLNEANMPDPPDNPYPVPPSAVGIFYQVSRMPTQGIRLITDVNGVDYCALVTATSGVVRWTSFNTQCWQPTLGAYLAGPPATSHKIVFEVPAIYGGPATPFNFCVDSVGYQAASTAAPDDGGTAKVGDPCTANGDCASDLCATSPTGGWCTQPCSATQPCGASSASAQTQCLLANNGTNYCFPPCLSQAACKAYSAGATCVERTNLAGTLVDVCTIGGGTAKIGDKCALNTDCASTSCAHNSSGLGAWCTELFCQSDADCGTNTAGVASLCLTTTIGTKLCYPGCTTTAECQAFVSTATCVLATGGCTEN